MKSRLLFKYCLHLPVWLLLGFTPILQAQSSCIQLRFSTETANSGDTVTIRLTTLGFDNISSYQLAARWNPADLQYLQHSTANSPLPYQLFNPSQTVQGKLLCVWSDINAIGVSLPDESLIFELKFRVLATVPGNYPVWIDPDASPKYEMVQGVKVVPFIHTFGGIQLDTPGGFGIASICVTPPPCNAPVGSIELVLNGGAAPFQYQWEGPNGYTSTESNPDSLLPGNYNVTITDATGAVARAATNLPFSYAAIAIGVINTQNAVCSQPNGCADLQISGGTGPYTFEWSAPGPATEDRCDLTPGYHYVTVTDVFGCKQSKYVEIENDSLLAVHLDSINADCRFGQLGGVQVSVSGTEPYTYHWSNGDTGASLSGIAPGVYSVTVSDAAGCDAKASVEIKDYGTFDWFAGLGCTCPTATSSGVLQLTAYDFAHRAVFPVTLNWSNGTVQELQSVDDNTVYPVLGELSGFGSGRYGVTITDAEGCSVRAETSADCAVHEPISDFNARFYIKSSPNSPIDSCATVNAADFKNITELQFSLRWHYSWMELKEIKNLSSAMGISMANFSVPSTGLINFQWISPSPQGFSYPVDFPLFKVCFKNGSWDTPLLDFAASGGAPKVVHATKGEIGFIGKNGRVYFDYGSNDEVVEKFNLAPPDCAYDGYARVQLESYANQNINPYKNLQFENGYSYYPKVTADTLLFAPPGTFHFRTSGTNNKMSRFFVHIPPYEPSSSDCVWPGDADNNGVVNHFDLLNLGLGFGTTGIARTAPDSLWAGADCADWPEQTPVHQLNYKNIDADGNGLVELADTAVIMQHWGRAVHPYNRDIFATPGMPDVTDDQCSLQLSADTLHAGKVVEIPIVFSSSGNPVSDLHGLAFSVSYDPAVVASALRFEPVNSWLGDPGTDLVGIQQDFRGQRRLDVALTRTDGIGVSGTGQIGKLILTFNTPPPDSILHTLVFISHSFALTSGEQRIVWKNSRSELWVRADPSVGVSGGSSPENHIDLSPNPASGFIRLESPVTPIRRVEISTVAGAIVQVIEPDALPHRMEIPLVHLPFSTYLARIFTENGVVLKKFVIAR